MNTTFPSNQKKTVLSKMHIINYYKHLAKKYWDSKFHKLGRGHPKNFNDGTFILFFTIMMLKEIYGFEAMERWLHLHPDEANEIGFASFPDRSTLSRRFKNLHETLRDFIQFVFEDGKESIGVIADSKVIYFDSSIFRACGNVWHAWDKAVGKKPDGLRKIDSDAEWTKGGYHQFQYGYKIHVGVTEKRYPVLIEIQKGNIHDAIVFDQLEEKILSYKPEYIVTDNSYCACRRIKRFKTNGVALITPGDRWTKTGPAQEYHKFLKEETPQRLLAYRKVVIEPFFDLVAKMIGATENHKQIKMVGLENVKTLFMLAFLALQICIRLNVENNEPQNRISVFMTLFK